MEGQAKGYSGLIDARGQFVKETSRKPVFELILGHWLDIEERIQDGTIKSRTDLYQFLEANAGDTPLHGQKWFNDICDTIELSPMAQIARKKATESADK